MIVNHMENHQVSRDLFSDKPANGCILVKLTQTLVYCKDYTGCFITKPNTNLQMSSSDMFVHTQTDKENIVNNMRDLLLETWWSIVFQYVPITNMFPLKASISFRGFPAHGLDFILSATRCRSRAMGATFSFGRKAKACRWRRVWLKNAWVQIPTQLAWFMEKIVMIMIWKWIVPSKIDGFNHQKWWV